MTRPAIPAFPGVMLEVVERGLATGPGFLEHQRGKLRTRGPNGEVSREFVYDSVTRRALDAVVIVAHCRSGQGERRVYLRSAIRPPVAERGSRPTPDGSAQDVQFWELPAGLVEPGEETLEGLAGCAARETHEELGFALDPRRFEPLGHGMYPLPGVIAERQFYFHVEVDADRRGEPSLDGSPLEESGIVFALPLSQALEMCAAGQILDAKTELGLRRFADYCASKK